MTRGVRLHQEGRACSPAALDTGWARPEQRRGARVEGLTPTAQERAAPAGPSADPDQPAPRVMLWADNPVLTAVVRALCALLALPLAEVTTAEALRAALEETQEGQGNAVLLVDAAGRDDEALERCLFVLPRATLPVYVIHPRATICDELARVARGAVYWLPADVGVLTLFSTLRVCKALGPAPATRAVEAARHAPALTPREQQVQHLKQAGHKTQEIAHELGVSESTVKSHASHIRDKGV